MKLTLAVPALAMMLSTTGCTTLLSTHAFVTEEQAIHEPGLAGVWTKGSDTILIRTSGKAYDIAYLDGKTMLKFTGRLFKAGDALIFDLTHDTDDPFALALHFAVRVWPEGGTLRWTILDADWLKDEVVRGIPSTHDGDRTIVGIGAPERLLKLGSDERAYRNVEVWAREQ